MLNLLKRQKMQFPEKFKVLVVTLSDRASRGEYEDMSGPAVRDKVSDYLKLIGWEAEVILRLIPDDSLLLHEILVKSAPVFNFIFTTGGTGIGPRDITVETVKPLLSKEIPGIMELIRVKYGMEKPNALLSRGVAGIIGNAVIYTLPGSLKAVNEYLTEIFKTIEHVVLMQYGLDLHKKAEKL
jgi:molybdopterin adenylyltransferase